MSLPNDVARCAGIGSDSDGWVEDCEDCLRRTDKTTGERCVNMSPPAVIVFFCECKIEPREVKK